MGFLNWYERQAAEGLASGMKVWFEQGLYFDHRVGPNWWEYYFEPIHTAEPSDEHIELISDSPKALWATEAISTISRERAGQLIRKYIKVKPHVQRKVDAFEERYFESRYVAGVHYRGTDKGNEAPKVAYEVVEAAVQQEIAGRSDAVIFVATDEQQCLDHLRAAFGARVVFIDALRSANYEPIHHLNGGWAATDRYALGEEALIDCMLLSRSNVIIRTQSNLSSSAGNINPTVPVVDLNRATYHDGLR
ncbi:MAG TPA: hypothetical protein VGG41_18710 [Solirubrobacteraceae bacterium]